MKYRVRTFVWGDESTFTGEFLSNNIHGKGAYKWAYERYRRLER